MNANSGSPVITQTLNTIGEAPAAPEAPEAPAAPETPAAPAAPAKPQRDPHLDLAKRFESAAQKESRARKAYREAEDMKASIAAREKRIAEREAELEDALSDPVGHMLKIGKDPVEIANRYAKPETPEEKRIRKLEEALEARTKEDKDRETAAQQRARAAAKVDTYKRFVGETTAAECPNLTTLYEAREVPGLVEALLHRPADADDPESPTMLQRFNRDFGRNPTDKEIREVLEYEAEMRATRLKGRSAAAAPPVDATSPGGQQQDSPKSEGGPNGISNQHAARSSGAAPKRPLTHEEKRKAARRELTAALEAEASDDKR